MKTIITETNVYKFAELPANVQQKTINSLYDINVDYEWWNFIYDDAKNIGLKISAFDFDHIRYIDGQFMIAANEVAANIFRDHGADCETYKTAEKFMEAWQPVFNAYMDEENELYESKEAENKLEALEDEFLKSLCEDYRIILKNEYKYLTSNAAIIETIELNDYDFTIDGQIF